MAAVYEASSKSMPKQSCSSIAIIGLPFVSIRACVPFSCLRSFRFHSCFAFRNSRGSSACLRKEARSCRFRSLADRLCGSLRSFCHLAGTLHEGLPELFGLVSEYLSLPTDELALKLRELLGILHTDQLVKKVERIRQSLFRSQHRPSDDSGRLLIEGIHRLTHCDHQCLDRSLALIEVLFADLSQPVHAIIRSLDCSFGNAFSEFHCTFGHSFASLIRGALAKCQLRCVGFTVCSARAAPSNDNDVSGEQFRLFCVFDHGMNNCAKHTGMVVVCFCSAQFDALSAVLAGTLRVPVEPKNTSRMGYGAARFPQKGELNAPSIGGALGRSEVSLAWTRRRGAPARGAQGRRGAQRPRGALIPFGHTVHGK